MTMPKRIVVEFKTRAINSLVLAIELFNRPHDRGRAESVLILLHHSFEMLLKSIIQEKTGTVQFKGEKYSYSFDRCLESAQNDLKILSKDERRTLSIMDAHRDTVVHYFLDISEDLLYIQAQAGVTLFDDLMRRVFGESLADSIPGRVLPVSTRPPKDLQLLLDSELSQVDELLQAGARKGVQAAARLRPILALARGGIEGIDRVSEKEIRDAVAKRKKGDDWSLIFPEIAQLRLDTAGDGIPVYLRIRKDAESAVRIGKEGEPIVGTLIKQSVDWFDKFNLNLPEIAKKLGLTIPKVRAYMFEINLWADPELYGEKQIKSQKYRRYTKKALDALREVVQRVPAEDVWERHGLRVRGQ